MTAIAAVLARSGPADSAATTRMLTAAPHRGAHRELQTHGRCTIGAVRRPGRPTAGIGRCGPLVAAVAGSPDNAAEVTRALTAAGFPPTSGRPADIVAAAFRCFGPDAPNHLRGPVAGIVSDGHRLWCFRDHLGFRPLFYRDDARACYVATEAKQIVAGAEVQREPDLDVLERVFYGRMPPDLPSALRGVSRLPQATTLVVGLGRPPAHHRYWHPERCLETLRLEADEVAERFNALFAQAVVRTLTGDDVVSLSGGVDSPAVAAFAAPTYLEQVGRPLAALSAVFPEHPRVDERRYVEQIAHFLGLCLRTYRLTARALDDVEQWCTLLDGPVPILAVPQVDEDCRLARRHGFRNILTGEFAEFVCAIDRNLVGHLLTHGRWRALARLLVAERQRGRSWQALTRETVKSVVPRRMAAWYARAHAGSQSTRIPDWLDPRRANEPCDGDQRPPLAWRRWPAQQLLGFDGAAVTLEADELCGALHGVTIRRPFADIDLWEFFLGLRAETKFPDRRPKSLLRALLRGRLPDSILDRRDKTVFDDYAMSQIDYPALNRLLVQPSHQVAGVHYDRLAARIQCEDLGWLDWFWAKDLARVHAFLKQW